MKRIEYQNIIDKSDFGPGPWQDEPDKIQWPDKGTGMPCLIVRNHMGALCGYVGLESDHPLYGKEYNDVDLVPDPGLTFGDYCQETDHGICHVPGEGEPDNLYWFGFDCAHCHDFIPGMDKYLPPELRPSRFVDETYKDVAYVQMKCALLAHQLNAATR